MRIAFMVALVISCVAVSAASAEDAAQAEKEKAVSGQPSLQAVAVPGTPSTTPLSPAMEEEAAIEKEQGKKIELPTVEVPEQIYQLKKIDPNRIGAETSYETFAGVRVPEKILRSPSIGVGQRVEIYQEPKPVDAYMIMFKEMQHTYADVHGYWRGDITYDAANFRNIVQEQFTRAYGTEFTLSDPKESSSTIKGQVRYTIDYRDIYREYYPKFEDIKMSRWLQNDVMLITMAKIEPIDWLYTSNVGYRYSTIDVKEINSMFMTQRFGDNTSGSEWRQTYYVNQSIAPNPRLELFGQGEYFKSEHDRCNWANEPDHYLIAGELRMKSKDMKTSYTGRFSYSLDIYSPFSNTFEKYEIWARVGRDFNDRFNAYTMLKYAYDHTRSEDNAMWVGPTPPNTTNPKPFPFDVTAIALTSENRAQYRIYDRLWFQGGLDLGCGINMSDFDNLGMLTGLEYYAPGIIRVDVGWRGNLFYNIDDTLGTVYFKVYFFM